MIKHDKTCVLPIEKNVIFQSLATLNSQRAMQAIWLSGVDPSSLCHCRYRTRLKLRGLGFPGWGAIHQGLWLVVGLT